MASVVRQSRSMVLSVGEDGWRRGVAGGASRRFSTPSIGRVSRWGLWRPSVNLIARAPTPTSSL